MMKLDLQKEMINYCDFLTGYENVLRDGETFNNPTLISVDGKVSLNNWPPQNGSVSYMGKDFGNRQVIHLINFANAASFDWCDTNGSQATPNTFQNLSFILTLSKPVTSLCIASPHLNRGPIQPIPFTPPG